MYKFNWALNNGFLFPNQGEVNKAKCGICGTQMSVRRNVNGPTSFSEAMARGAHLHDSFTCPHLMERWHTGIVNLKMEAYASEGEYKVVKRELEKRVKKILKAAGKK